MKGKGPWPLRWGHELFVLCIVGAAGLFVAYWIGGGSGRSSLLLPWMGSFFAAVGLLGAAAVRWRDRGRVEINVCREVVNVPFEAYVTMRSHEDRLVTEFVAALGGGGYSLRVASRDWASERHEDLGLTEIGAGVPEGYRVHTNRMPRTFECLGRDAWSEIAAIDRLHGGAFLLEIRPGSLVIRAEGALRERAKFLRFMSLATSLAERVHAFLETESGALHVTVQGGSCPVCSAPLDEACVTCRRCATPHHEDCWKYNGMCAVYACRGRETRPQAGPRASVARPMPGAVLPGFSGVEVVESEPFDAWFRNGTLAVDGRQTAYLDFWCEIPGERSLVELSCRDSRGGLGLGRGLTAAKVDGLPLWEVQEEEFGQARERIGRTLIPVLRRIPEATLGPVAVSMGRGRLHVRGMGPGLDPEKFVQACWDTGRHLRGLA